MKMTMEFKKAKGEMLTQLQKEAAAVKSMIHEQIGFQDNCETEEISDLYLGENGVIRDFFCSMKVPKLPDYVFFKFIGTCLCQLEYHLRQVSY